MPVMSPAQQLQDSSPHHLLMGCVIIELRADKLTTIQAHSLSIHLV